MTKIRPLRLNGKLTMLMKAGWEALTTISSKWIKWIKWLEKCIESSAIF